MMESLLVLAALVLGVMLMNVMGRLKQVERALDELRGGSAPMPARPDLPPAPQPPAPPPVPDIAPPPVRRTARVVRATLAADLPEAIRAPAPPEPPRPPAPPAPGAGFENLVGARLPIWIGGAALVLAAFFLVRYSIESGLLGPGVRVVLAALFGIALLGGSEAARRLTATADDPRIAQALAGAGIASLYGTLYMAAELYGLVSALPAFGLMVVITAAALGLSLRHGPPTAVMGLIGGFAAPLVTGVDAAGIVPLLVYLALFTAGLFALAIHRGWLWLALAATGGGLLWPFLLLGLVDGSALGWVGLFALTLAVAATLALPRAGTAGRFVRIAPLVTGLLQLLLIGPAMDFSPLAWGLFGLLAAATIALGWRDPKLTIGAAASFAVSLALLSIGLVSGGREYAPLAGLGVALLFGAAGHALARRDADGRIWTGIALGAALGPILLVYMLGVDLPGDAVRAALAAAAAFSAAMLAWRFRDHASVEPRFDQGLAGGAAAAGVLALLAFGQFDVADWFPVAAALVSLALSAWAVRAGDGWTARVALLPFSLAALAQGLAAMSVLAVESLAGNRLPYLDLPPLIDVARQLALPGAILAGAAWLARRIVEPRLMPAAIALAGVPLAATLYALLKQPLAIDDPARFITHGLLERALFTQALLVAGWALLAHMPRARIAGLALLGLGLFRFIWFDVLLLNPVFVSQQVGALPILNLAVLHTGLAALWLWLSAPRMPAPQAARIGALLLTALTALAAVRQLIHGSLLIPPHVTVTENYLYSAALLVLALVWLWRAIVAQDRLLRLAGLALLVPATLKVFLIDAAALTGILRILSFLGLGVALILIGWAYNRFLGQSPGKEPVTAGHNDLPAGPAPG